MLHQFAGTKQGPATNGDIITRDATRSVKYEDVYLKGYSNAMELMIGLAEYFVFYNDERPHQSLRNRTPAGVYDTANGGGARIVDKFSKNGATPCSCEKDGQASLN